MTHTPEPWDVVHVATKSGPSLLRVHARYGNPNMDDSQLAPVTRLGDGINAEANAAYIVRAVNTNAKLLEALEVCRTWLENTPFPSNNQSLRDSAAALLVVTVQAAINEAKGESNGGRS